MGVSLALGDVVINGVAVFIKTRPNTIYLSLNLQFDTEHVSSTLEIV